MNETTTRLGYINWEGGGGGGLKIYQLHDNEALLIEGLRPDPK